MVLFSRRIRIQRIKIHKTRGVSTPEPYTFFCGPVYFVLMCFNLLLSFLFCMNFKELWLSSYIFVGSVCSSPKSSKSFCI